MLMGRNTKVVIDWFSKRQRVISKSTCEAELTAISDGIMKLGLLNLMLFQAVFDDKVKLIVKTDSRAAYLAIKDGWSKMRYVSKTQKVTRF